jgi:hypothetical protein
MLQHMQRRSEHLDADASVSDDLLQSTTIYICIAQEATMKTTLRELEHALRNIRLLRPWMLPPPCCAVPSHKYHLNRSSSRIPE